MNNLTLAEFDKLKSIAEIRTALFGQDTYSEQTEYETDERGQLRQVVVVKNALTDAVVEKQETTWDYHETGEVKDIVTRKLDSKDKELARRTVRNFRDTKQPELIEEVTYAVLG